MASNQFTSLRFNLFHNGRYTIKVVFNETAKYISDNHDNQKDWNKLAGVSWGFKPLAKQFQMHENSSRWGWRYNPETDCVEIAPYYYNNGQRHYAENSNLKILSLPYDKKTKLFKPAILDIVPNKEYNLVHYIWATKWLEMNKTIEMQNVTIQSAKQSVPSVAGFIAPMYFGGDSVAQRDIRTEIENINNYAIETRYT